MSASAAVVAAGSSAGSGSESKDAELEVAVKKFQELRRQEQAIYTKINEMSSQEMEYRCACIPSHRMSFFKAAVLFSLQD